MRAGAILVGVILLSSTNADANCALYGDQYVVCDDGRLYDRSGNAVTPPAYSPLPYSGQPYSYPGGAPGSAYRPSASNPGFNPPKQGIYPPQIGNSGGGGPMGPRFPCINPTRPWEKPCY
jgi:hypothetical protein